jgi:hypothetical protein
MTRTSNKIVYFLLLYWGVSILLGGCAYLQEQVLSPKQTMYWAMNVYNSEWDKYVRKTVKPEFVQAVIKEDIPITKDMVRTDLSDEEWEVLETRKNLLSDLFPYIEVADKALEAGGMPDEETQDDIVYLINRLIEGD